MSTRTVIFLLVALLGPVADIPALTVGRIRIEIDGIRFTDEGDGLHRDSPETDGMPGTAPETILTFTALRPGARLTEEKLLLEVRRTGKRLADSGYFYDTRAIAVPSAEDPSVWNVKITVSGGFRLRFGGGESFAMFGLAAPGGRRQELRFWGGYNRAGAAWEGQSHRRYYWETSALYTNEGSFDHPPRWHRVEMTAGGGWQPLPDIRLGAVLKPVWYGTGRTDLRVGPEFRLSTALFPDPFLLEAEFRGQGFGSVPVSAEDGGMTVQTEAEAQFKLGWRFLTLGGKAAGGWSEKDTPPLYYANLHDTEDRSVRSGWSAGELTAGTWAFLSAEPRIMVFERFIPPFLALGTELFLFTDHAFVPEWRDAWGAGLRIKLDNPMFVFFTFSLGWNREGEPRFALTTTAGF